MAKFKASDRVRNTDKDDPKILFGELGTVMDVSIYPLVKWDNCPDKRPHSEDLMELITEPSVPTETGPAPGTLEHWRFLFAGQAMQGLLCGLYRDTSKYNLSEVQKESVGMADALIAELKGGKP